MFWWHITICMYIHINESCLSKLIAESVIPKRIHISKSPPYSRTSLRNSAKRAKHHRVFSATMPLETYEDSPGVRLRSIQSFQHFALVHGQQSTKNTQNYGISVEPSVIPTTNNLQPQAGFADLGHSQSKSSTKNSMQQMANFIDVDNSRSMVSENDNFQQPQTACDLQPSIVDGRNVRSFHSVETSTLKRKRQDLSPNAAHGSILKLPR